VRACDAERPERLRIGEANGIVGEDRPVTDGIAAA